MSDRYLIVGLGNPGKKYQQTRHNIGFMLVDEIARKYNMEAFRSERKALVTDGIIKGQRVYLAKPQTYMNLSGESVRALVDFYKFDLANIMVIHDDLDTPFGALRIRSGGGHGGQNGMRNIIQHLGTNDFSRMRFGIGRPPGRMKPVDYVLTQFLGDDEILLQETANRAIQSLETWISEGVEIAMSQFNGDGKEPPPPQVKPEDELKLFQRAHELSPTDPKPIEKMIPLLKRLGQLDEASQCHLQLGDLYEQQGKTKKALDHWQQAASLQPAQINLHHKIAETYLESGNQKKGVNRYLILAEYLLEQGNFAEAQTIIELALELNPQHPKAIDLSKKLTEYQKVEG